jgi:hypothetical protein
MNAKMRIETKTFIDFIAKAESIASKSKKPGA